VAKYVGIESNVDVSVLDSMSSTGLNIKLKTRLLNGLANTNATLDVPTTCPTGNCTFENDEGTYLSTGFCHRCWNSAPNITDHSSGNFTRWSELPNGVSVGLQSTTLNVSTSIPLSWFPMANDSSSSDMFAASEANLTILAESRLPCDNAGGHQNSLSGYPRCYVAASCVMYPCLKKYTGRVENGRLIENIESTSPILKLQSDNRIADSRGVAWPCKADGETYDASNISTATSKKHDSLKPVRFVDDTEAQIPYQCVYTMDYGYRNAIADYLRSLRGGCYERRANPNSLSCLDDKNVELFYNSGNASYQSIDNGLERITRAITNRMREIGTQSNGSDSLASVVTGTAHQTFVCTRFEWYWLLFPAILLVATGLLLVMVVLGGLFDRQSHPTWKSSVLPLLLHGPHSVGDGVDQVGDRLAEMTKTAERTLLTLRKEDDGTWKLLWDVETTGRSRTS
jgi:hypothetical protein